MVSQVVFKSRHLFLPFISMNRTKDSQRSAVLNGSSVNVWSYIYFEILFLLLHLLFLTSEESWLQIWTKGPGQLRHQILRSTKPQVRSSRKYWRIRWRRTVSALRCILKSTNNCFENCSNWSINVSENVLFVYEDGLYFLLTPVELNEKYLTQHHRYAHEMEGKKYLEPGMHVRLRWDDKFPISKASVIQVDKDFTVLHNIHIALENQRKDRVSPTLLCVWKLFIELDDEICKCIFTTG